MSDVHGMSLPCFWIDAFTDRVFSGNPAGVVPLEHWLPDDVMQRIAFENGLSETAFFVRTGPGQYHLRWFTPAIEVELCGHATLASAHVLWTEFGERAELITFVSRSGLLHVVRAGDGLELDFPSQPAVPAAAPDLLIQGLGRQPEFIGRAGTRWLCVFAQTAEVRALRPDQARLAQVTPGRMIVTAPGDDCDFVSRFFAPDAGVTEDPVTGSAHCTLTPYWAERLGKPRLHARQVSARGGELWCELRGDRVGIAGRAVTYLRGEIAA
jgi:predicted PhzF superfamily epimerase YddE/YHI9